jgi:hypothetical protein
MGKLACFREHNFTIMRNANRPRIYQPVNTRGITN